MEFFNNIQNQVVLLLAMCTGLISSAAIRREIINGLAEEIKCLLLEKGVFCHKAKKVFNRLGAIKGQVYFMVALMCMQFILIFSLYRADCTSGQGCSEFSEITAIYSITLIFLFVASIVKLILDEHTPL